MSPEDIMPMMKDKHSSLFSIRQRRHSQNQVSAALTMTPAIMTKRKLPSIEDQITQR